MAAYIRKILASPKSHMFSSGKYEKSCKSSCKCELFSDAPNPKPSSPVIPLSPPVAKASWPRLLPKALEVETNRRNFMTCTFESFKIYHHLESRWRNSHVLVYHGPLLSHLLEVAPSTFTRVYLQKQ